ncbi:hypothetical protein [Escherichia coli]
MGITSGWVGSSAKSETGEQWMGAAGTMNRPDFPGECFIC